MEKSLGHTLHADDFMQRRQLSIGTTLATTDHRPAAESRFDDLAR